jgi:hypothetical protein
LSVHKIIISIKITDFVFVPAFDVLLLFPHIAEVLRADVLLVLISLVKKLTKRTVTCLKHSDLCLRLPSLGCTSTLSLSFYSVFIELTSTFLRLISSMSSSL